MSILDTLAHRPFALPSGRWRMAQRWNDLLFAHWPIPVADMAALLPASLEPDTFDGFAWLGVVPFWMDQVRTRHVGESTFTVPGTTSFPELNLRTYVRPRGSRLVDNNQSGVYFFSLDAASPLAVLGARTLFHLPYFWARMHRQTRTDGTIDYTSLRLLTRRPVRFDASYKPTGALAPSTPGTLAHFLTERYCLYTAHGRRLSVGHIHHLPWPLEAAEAEIRTNELPAAHGLILPNRAPILHFARELHVYIWGLRQAGSILKSKSLTEAGTAGTLILAGENKANMSTADTTLFPILDQRPSGIARMAADATHADDGHLVEFKGMKVRGILNKSISKRRLSLAYSINPYRGCEFGCRYCYARYTHEFLAPKEGASPDTTNLRDPEAFERLIFIKENAAWLLEQELRRIDPAQEIALGTATDPYQPIERRARVTRGLLEVFARREGHRLGIVTKSALITRDIDLLREIARRNVLVVHLTITTADAELARKLEPRAPRPDLRFAAIRRLREAGLTAGVLCSPLLPGITDNAPALDGMARLAREADASFFAAQPLFLKPCSRPTYLSFIEQHFPALMPDYRKRFDHADFAAAPYRRQMAALVEDACRRHGLRERSSDALLTRDTGRRKLPASVGTPAQQALFA